MKSAQVCEATDSSVNLCRRLKHQWHYHSQREHGPETAVACFAYTVCACTLRMHLHVCVPNASFCCLIVCGMCAGVVKIDTKKHMCVVGEGSSSTQCYRFDGDDDGDEDAKRRWSSGPQRPCVANHHCTVNHASALWATVSAYLCVQRACFGVRCLQRGCAQHAFRMAMYRAPLSVTRQQCARTQADAWQHVLEVYMMHLTYAAVVFCRQAVPHWRAWRLRTRIPGV